MAPVDCTVYIDGIREDSVRYDTITWGSTPTDVISSWNEDFIRDCLASFEGGWDVVTPEGLVQEEKPEYRVYHYKPEKKGVLKRIFSR